MINLSAPVGAVQNPALQAAQSGGSSGTSSTAQHVPAIHLGIRL